MTDVAMLEQIVGSAVQELDSSEVVVDFNLEGKTAPEIKAELEKWKKEIVDDNKYISFQTSWIKDVLARLQNGRSTPEEILTAIQQMNQQVADLRNRRNTNNARAAMFPELVETYKARRLPDAGFETTDEVYKEIGLLYDEQGELQRKRFGASRFKNEIQALDDRIETLNSLTWGSSYFERPDAGYHYRLDELSQDLLHFTANTIMTQYDQILSATKDDEHILTPEDLESLTEHYLAVHVSPALERQKNWKVKMAGDKDVTDADVANALKVAREGINRPMYQYPGKVYTPEEKKKRDSLRKNYESLPYGLQNVIEWKLRRGDDELSSDEKFEGIAMFIRGLDDEETLTGITSSYIQSLQSLITASETTRTYNYTLENREKQLSEQLQELGTAPLNIDILRWRLFADNERMQSALGSDTLQEGEEVLGHALWDRLLSIRPISGEHDGQEYSQLSTNAPSVTQTEQVPYAVMNFWRGTGQGTIMPQLSEAGRFMQNLSEEKIQQLQEENIPGLMQIIEAVRQDKTVINRKREDDALSAQLYGGLTDLVVHYLQNGTEKEQNFALGTAVPLMERVEADDPNRDRIIEAVSDMFGFTQSTTSVFKKQYDLLAGQLRQAIERTTNLQGIGAAIGRVDDYFTGVDEIIARAIHPDALAEEAQQLERGVLYTRNVDTYVTRALEFLESVDSEVVQRNLADPVQGEIYRTILTGIAENLESHNREPDPTPARIQVWNEYFDAKRTLLDQTSHPETVRTISDIVEESLHHVSHDVQGAVEAAIAFYHALDSDIVAEVLQDEKNTAIMKEHIGHVWTSHRDYKTDSYQKDKYTPEDLEAHIVNLHELVRRTTDIVETAQFPDNLEKGKETLLNEWTWGDRLLSDPDPDFIDARLSWLSALDDPEIVAHQESWGYLRDASAEVYRKEPSLAKGFVQYFAVHKTYQGSEHWDAAEFLVNIKDSVFQQFVAYAQDNSAKAWEYALILSGEDSSDIRRVLDQDSITFEDVYTAGNELDSAGIIQTPYLIRQLSLLEDRIEETQKWQDVMAGFEEGKFDSENELHRNLEYTRFKTLVENEKMKHFIKNQLTFEQYLEIFDGKAEGLQFSNQDQFEIDCAAHEAGLLANYILRVKEIADELGRPVKVVPNLSYGYLPTTPTMHELEEQGIEFIIGAKIGSTESHENKEVMNSRLFKYNRGYIANEQPIIIVVDGTQHLVEREGDGKGSRFPDAYQGYLNQIIAVNDALGFTGQDYVGKTEEDIEVLRNTPEFQRTVKIYQELAKDSREHKPYGFELWNTAGLELMLRGGRQEVAKAEPFDPKKIKGPTMIFANVGILDEQVPDEIKARYDGLEHQPAYFDDSGRIISFDFGHNKFGVQYLNRLETAMQEAYRKSGRPTQAGGLLEEMPPAILQYVGTERRGMDEVA